MKKEELKFLKNSMLYVPNGGTVVEIGSWMGGSSEQLARGIEKWCPKTQLFCVDPFDTEYFNATKGLRQKMKRTTNDVLGTFKRRMKRYKYKLLRMLSEKAVEQFTPNSINFVFIDANHDYEHVKQDIELWWPLLVPNGIMCGHDFGKWGVTKAVREVFPDALNPVRTIWKIQK